MLDFLNLLFGESALDNSRDSSYKRATQYVGVLADKGTGSDETVAFDYRTIQNPSSHPDQAIVLNRTAMQYSRVSYRHAISNPQFGFAKRAMKHRTVLDVGLWTLFG